MKDIYNSKNIIVLSYQSVEALSEFFEWYYNPQKNKNFSFGIIRAGLNVEFIPQNITNFSTKSENETKDKAFYHTCILTNTKICQVCILTSIISTLSKIWCNWPWFLGRLANKSTKSPFIGTLKGICSSCKKRSPTNMTLKLSSSMRYANFTFISFISLALIK